MTNRTAFTFRGQTPGFWAIVGLIWFTALFTIYLTWKPYIARAHSPPPPIQKPIKECTDPIKWGEIRTMFRQSVNVIDVSPKFRREFAATIRITEGDRVNQEVPDFIENATEGFMTSVYLNQKGVQVVSFVGITSPCKGMRAEFPLPVYKHILALMNLKMDWNGKLLKLTPGDA